VDSLVRRLPVSVFVMLGIMAGAVAAAIASQGLLRRVVRDEARAELAGRGTTFEYIFTAFSVLLAFVVLETFDQYNDARAAAESEAVAVIEQSRTADAFASEDRKELEALLACYARAVVHQEWPVMRDGAFSETVDHWVVGLRDASIEVDVKPKAEQDFFLKWLDEGDLRTEGRQIRITEATRGVPGTMWVVLVLGAVLTVGWVLFHADPRGHALVQAVLAGAVTALAIGSILLVWALDHPYSGTGSIGPSRMEHAIETMKVEQRVPTLPCTDSGEPLAGTRT
jgi:Protein of unknown function (DUF4239)